MGKRGQMTNDAVLYKKQCKYIGSIAVSQRNVDDRQQYINEKFAEMKDVVKGVPVVLMITDEGVKVLNENGSNVKMAHGVSRIILSTCQPEKKLFAYLAKSMTSEKKTIIQAHMFKTKRSSHAKEINVYLSKAFKMAHNRATIKIQEQEKLFEKDAVQNKTQRAGKRWAKQELAHGHKHAAHAQHAHRKITPSDNQIPSNNTDQNVLANQTPPVPRHQNQPVSANQQKYPSSNDNQIESDTYLLPVDGMNSQAQTNDTYLLPVDGMNSQAQTDDTYLLPVDGMNSQCQSDDTYILPVDGTKNQGQSKDNSLDTGYIQMNKPVNETYERPWDNVPKIYQDLNTNQNAVQPVSSSQSTKSANAAPRYDNMHIDYQNVVTEGSDRSSTKKTSITQKEGERQDDILELNWESNATEKVQKVNNFVSPAQRFSSIENEQRFSTRESSFEGYVNVTDRNDLPSINEMYDNTRDSQFELSEEDILKNAEWYQAGFSREIAETILADRPVGSFYVRMSMTKAGCFVMTVKIPTSAKPSGIGNFVISTENNVFRLKGFHSTFNSLTDLVAHYGSVQEDIPTQLLLGNDNLMCTRKNTCELDNPDDDGDYDDTIEYDDPDYQYFTCADDMLYELNNISEQAI